MRAWWIIAAGLASSFAPAQAMADSVPVEYKVAPGGKIVYYILKSDKTDAAGNAITTIGEEMNGNTSFRTLVTPRLSSDPKQNLTGFSHLFLSPDSNILYFESNAWATANAVHALNLNTGKVSYVTDGFIACVVLAGQYQGDLIVQQHRYFIQGGSHDDLWLYEPSGRRVGQVAEGTDASRVCPILGD